MNSENIISNVFDESTDKANSNQAPKANSNQIPKKNIHSGNLDKKIEDIFNS